MEEDVEIPITIIDVKCEICGKEFNNNRSLGIHKKVHTREKAKGPPELYTCEKCGKVAKTKQALDRHAAYHESDRPYSCDVCLQRFKNTDDRGKHYRRLRRDGKLEFACTVCHKHFKGQDVLSKHLVMLGCANNTNNSSNTQDTSHNGKLNILSLFIKNTKTDNASLNEPTDNNKDTDNVNSDTTRTIGEAACDVSDITDVKPVIDGAQTEAKLVCSCKVCEAEFNNANDLKCHYRESHQDKKRQVCLQCGQTLSSKDSLMRHYSIFHQTDFPFTCDICDLKFKIKESLCRHVKFVHKDGGYTCTICERIFSQPVNLKKHMAVHSSEKEFACEYCGRKFRWKQALQKHELLHKSGSHSNHDHSFHGNKIKADCKITVKVPFDRKLVKTAVKQSDNADKNGKLDHGNEQDIDKKSFKSVTKNENEFPDNKSQGQIFKRGRKRKLKENEEIIDKEIKNSDTHKVNEEFYLSHSNSDTDIEDYEQDREYTRNDPSHVYTIPDHNNKYPGHMSTNHDNHNKNGNNNHEDSERFKEVPDILDRLANNGAPEEGNVRENTFNNEDKNDNIIEVDDSSDNEDFQNYRKSKNTDSLVNNIDIKDLADTESITHISVKLLNSRHHTRIDTDVDRDIEIKPVEADTQSGSGSCYNKRKLPNSFIRSHKDGNDTESNNAGDETLIDLQAGDVSKDTKPERTENYEKIKFAHGVGHVRKNLKVGDINTDINNQSTENQEGTKMTHGIVPENLQDYIITPDNREFRPSSIQHVLRPSSKDRKPDEYKFNGTISFTPKQRFTNPFHIRNATVSKLPDSTDTNSELDLTTKTSKRSKTLDEASSSSSFWPAVPKRTSTPLPGKFSLIKHMLTLQNEDRFDKTLFDNALYKHQPIDFNKMAEMHKINSDDDTGENVVSYDLSCKQNIPLHWLGLNIGLVKQDMAKMDKSNEKFATESDTGHGKILASDDSFDKTDHPKISNEFGTGRNKRLVSDNSFTKCESISNGNPSIGRGKFWENENRIEDCGIRDFERLRHSPERTENSHQSSVEYNSSPFESYHNEKMYIATSLEDYVAEQQRNTRKGHEVNASCHDSYKDQICSQVEYGCDEVIDMSKENLSACNNTLMDGAINCHVTEIESNAAHNQFNSHFGHRQKNPNTHMVIETDPESETDPEFISEDLCGRNISSTNSYRHHLQDSSKYGNGQSQSVGYPDDISLLNQEGLYIKDKCGNSSTGIGKSDVRDVAHNNLSNETQIMRPTSDYNQCHSSSKRPVAAHNLQHLNIRHKFFKHVPILHAHAQSKLQRQNESMSKSSLDFHHHSKYQRQGEESTSKSDQSSLTKSSSNLNNEEETLPPDKAEYGTDTRHLRGFQAIKHLVNHSKQGTPPGSDRRSVFQNPFDMNNSYALGLRSRSCSTPLQQDVMVARKLKHQEQKVIVARQPKQSVTHSQSANNWYGNTFSHSEPDVSVFDLLRNPEKIQ